jgi:putative RNA 2'-phosphotransferase
MLNHDSFGLVSQQELKEFLLAKFEDRDHEGVKTTIELQLQQLAIREQIEFRGQRVRALYGHSLWNILVGTVDCPPPLLWHTTADRHREAILLGGLRKRNRSYIHLTSQFSYAAELAMSNSLSQDPILLAVDTQKCLDLGAVFRKPNSHVWLTNRVPPSTVRVVCESAGWWHQPPLRN